MCFLLGAIFSYVFLAPSQVFQFAGKNAWLLIAGVPVLLIERIAKRRD